MNIVLTGSKGLLGSTLKQKLKINYKIFEISRSERPYSIDLCDYNKTENLFDEIKPNLIINLAANTDLDSLESNFYESININFNIIKNIVDYILINKKNIKLIHLTTDQYYNLDKLNKENEINIINNYTFSKYISEIYASKINSLILRTNFFGKSYSKNKLSFSDVIINSLKNNQSISLFNDVIFSPLSMKTLSEIILKILNTNINGIYNLGSKKGMSKYDFGIELAKLYSYDVSLIKMINLEDKQLIAKRPFDMRMDVSKFENKFNISLPNLIDEIKDLK